VTLRKGEPDNRGPVGTRSTKQVTTASCHAASGISRIATLPGPLLSPPGAALQAFQARDLFALLADRLFQGGEFAEQINQQSLKLWTVQIGEVGWRRHIRKESHRVEPGQEKNAALPPLLPVLAGTSLVLILQYTQSQ